MKHQFSISLLVLSCLVFDTELHQEVRPSSGLLFLVVATEILRRRAFVQCDTGHGNNAPGKCRGGGGGGHAVK